MARFIALPILPVACLLWFLVPAQATPVPVPRADQLVLHLQQQDLTAAVGSVTVYFNPKELTVDKSVPWEKKKATEGDHPELEFTAAEPKTFSCELMFDTYEDQQDPAKIVAQLDNLVGKSVLITWGGRLWTATLKLTKVRTIQPGKKKGPHQLVVQTHWSDPTRVDPVAEYPFRVEIPGAPEASRGIREVSIDPVVLPIPPEAQPRARFVIASPKGIDPDLLKWQQAWAAGVEIRRAILVTMFDGQVPVRTCTLNAGGPIRLTVDDPNAVVPYLTLDVTFDGMKVNSPDAGNAGPRTSPLPAYYFEVEIEGIVYDFKSCGGLKIEQDVVDIEEGGILAPKPRLAGKGRWPPLILVGEPRIPMAGFLEWVDAAAIGRAIRKPVKITPVYVINGKPQPAPALYLEDVVPVRYAFPNLSAVWSEGGKTESTSLPPSPGVVK